MEEKLPSPSIALAAYAEAFLSGRRAVVFGDSLSGLAEHLVDRGARLVQVYDPVSERVAEATARNTSRHVSFSLLSQAGVPTRDGAFDVAIIEDLSELPDARSALALLRQALAARGIGFVVSPNPDTQHRFGHPQRPDAASYYDLYDVVCSEFDEVRMLGQAPFVGFALADFSPDSEDEFSIDTSFVPGGAEEPEWYVAAVSHFPVACDPFSVVQLPASELMSQVNIPRRLREELRAARQQVEQLKQRAAVHQTPAPPARTHETQQRLHEAQLELERRDVWVKELEARAATADTRADEADSRADEAEARAETLEARVKRAEGRAQDSEARATQAEARAQDLETRATQAEARAAQIQAQAAQAEAPSEELESLRRQLSEARERLRSTQGDLQRLEQQRVEDQAERANSQGEARAQLEREFGELQRRAKHLAEQVAQHEQRNVRLQDDLRAQSGELAELELQLVDRGKQVRALTRALAATERFAEQLLWDLDDTRELGGGDATSPADDLAARVRKLEAQLDGLARTDAQRVADLTAARWTIAELENKLTGQEALDTGETERQLQLARAQLQHQATLLKQYTEKTRA